MAFKIPNPLHLHATGHTGDPKDSKKKYGKVTVKKEKKGNTTTVTATRPYSTKTNKGKDLGPDFKPTKAQNDKANEARRATGSDTKSITVVDKKQIRPKKLSTTPKPKIDLQAKPSVAKDYGSFTYGSNMHNKDFGGHSTYAKTTAGTSPDFSEAYTESPKNSISGKPNIATSRKITSRENQLMQSNAYNKKYHPYKDGEKKFEQHLKSIENFEKKKNDKIFARKKITDKRKADLSVKKQALKAKQNAIRAKKKK